MKSISYWAKNNPRKAQLSIVLMYLLLNFFGITLGVLLFESDIFFSNHVFNTSLVFFILSVLIYNRKARYHYRKSLDLLLISSTFVMICFFGNKLWQNESVVQIFHQTATGITFKPLNKEQPKYQNNSKHKSVDKKEGRKPIRDNLKKRILHLQPWLKALLILGVVAFAIFTIYLIGLLSCNLSCSGAEGLAIVVLVVGLAGVIFGSIFMIRTVLGRKKTKKKNRILDVPEPESEEE